MMYINLFRDNMWPGGHLKTPDAPRTAEERLRTREEANRKLSALMPGMCTQSDFSMDYSPSMSLDLAANMIGRSNARRGARRIFAVLQNRRLNQHLIYTIVDEVAIASLFSCERN